MIYLGPKIFILLNLLMVLSLGATEVVRSQTKACGIDSRLNRYYCLELIKIATDTKNQKQPLLLIPGLLQNGNIFDLDPDNNISLARYLAQKFNLDIYIMNPRTVGKSDYLPRTNLDDLAIDDINIVVNSLYSIYQQKLVVIGHSQGAITLGAYASGLTRCETHNCFNKKRAQFRQQKLKGLGFLAGYTKLELEENSPIRVASKTYQFVRPTLFFNDKLPIKILAKVFRSLGHVNIFDLVVNEDNVSDEAKVMLLKNTVDATSVGILDQFTQGVLAGELMSIGFESYTNALENIKVKVYQHANGADPVSPAELIQNVSFPKIGSEQKILEVFPIQGHEDVFLNPTLHFQLDYMLYFLTK
ncbi:MAG: hypothetical protein CME62_10070 [Halobacteriovoraceae bacterium]|nr:hypothetical protein [Halobacteriovoraceae bacterium]|tara:strand:- start:2957 stop:4033 length:1077 start_codon:yes stop_codon:yes gene_type:complete